MNLTHYNPDPSSYTPPPTAPPPVRPVQRPPSYQPYVTYIMIASCVLVYIGQVLTPLANGLDLFSLYGAKINDAIIQGQYWRLLTPMWLHGSILHIAFNMYALYIFGTNLERYYGHWRFLWLYMLGGYAGNVVSFLMSPAISLGSSTAIFGLIAAQGVFLYKNRQLIRNARGMLMNTIIIAAVNLVLGTSSGIDNWGHLGGLLGGLAYAWSAGPVWLVQTDLNGIRLVNQRSRQRVFVVAIAVFLLFSFIAAVKIYMA